MSLQRKHFPLIDVIKAVAAQMIVLHHLAWYGPMTDVASGDYALMAHLQAWFAEYGRYAVAAFLVTGGFLAAQTLSPRGLPVGQSPWRMILQRYIRLVGPFAAALALATVAILISRKLMVHDSIGDKPQLKQLLAHLLLVHDLLGFDAITAGAWYIAVDFQLYALLILALWLPGVLTQRAVRVDFWGGLLVGMLGIGSLFYFNRLPDWEAYGLYFFGAYSLGVGAAWALRSTTPRRLLLLLAIIGCAALILEFRPRPAVALATALLLGFGQLSLRMREQPIFTVLSRYSYALFLVHFPICLIVNGVVTRLAPDSATLNVVGILTAWGVSNLVAVIFHRYVEQPLSRVCLPRFAFNATR